MTFQDIKQKYIDGLIATNAFIVKSINEEPFTKRSGQKSYIFLDHSKVASSPKGYRAFIDGIQYLLEQSYGTNDFILCNVDSKISAQMAGSVAYNLDKAQIIYKSSRLVEIEKGTFNQLTGDPEWKLPVAILDDVVTGGDGTAKGVGDLIHAEFPYIKDIQIFVGFTREVAKNTYKTHYILTMDELIHIVWNTLSDEQKQAVEKEVKQA